MADEEKYDIPDFSHIEDRVARAKAKAAAMRAAKGGGAAPAVPAPAPAAPAAAEDRVARAKAKAEAARAAKGAGETAPAAAPATAKAAEASAAPPKVERKVKTGPTTPPPEFRPGVVLRINGKNALIIAGRKSRFVLVYEQDPIEQRIPVDRVRLEREWFLGNLEVVSVGPPPVEKISPKKILAYAAAAGVTGVFFAVTGYELGPLGLFLVIPAAYFLFGLASRVPDVEF